jgi:YD repeat-containing protein
MMQQENNKTLRTDARGQFTTYVYDQLNRNVGYTYNNGNRATFTYDQVGRQSVMAEWTGTTSYSYDAGRRLVGIAYPSAKTLTYSYDANSRKKQEPFSPKDRNNSCRRRQI